MQKLRYDPVTGVWMPPVEMRPKQQQFAQPEPMIRNQPQFRQVPVMPAYPRRPKVRYAQPQGNIRGPQHGTIPNRPIIRQPNLPHLPERVAKKAKWGQYAITNTVPEPKVLPKPNLPNIARYNAKNMRTEQARINSKIRHRGGGMPQDALHTRGLVKHRRVKPVDLGINKTKGSNSQLLNFGSHLGRTVGSSAPYGHNIGGY